MEEKEAEVQPVIILVKEWREVEEQRDDILDEEKEVKTDNIAEEENIRREEEEDEVERYEQMIWRQRVRGAHLPVRIRTLYKFCPFTLETIKEEEQPEEEEKEEEQVVVEEEEEVEEIEIETIIESAGRPLGQEVRQAWPSEESIQRRRWWKPRWRKRRCQDKDNRSARDDRAPSRFIRCLLCCFSIDTVE